MTQQMAHNEKHEPPGSWKEYLFSISARVLLLPALLFTGIFLPAQADDPAPDEHTARHEVDFMQHATDHYLEGIRLAELCTQRATTPELIDLCTTMLSAQQGESDQLLAWLQEWYDESHEPSLAGAQDALNAQLETLSDSDFERTFLQLVIPHHMAGIGNAAMCEVQLFHDELLDMCATSIATQAEEIRTMRTLLCEEHGICTLELRENPVTDSPMSAEDSETPQDIDTPDDDMPVPGDDTPDDDEMPEAGG